MSAPSDGTFSVKVTEHANSRARERCGLTPLDLVAQVCTAALAGNSAVAHQHHEQPASPPSGVDDDDGRFIYEELWIPVVGYDDQPGTAIIKTRPRGWTIITVRNASSATQAEDQESLTSPLGESESFRQLILAWKEEEEEA